MKIIRIDPRTDILWRCLLEQQPGSVFHSPDWLKVIGDTYNFDIFALIGVDETNTPVAGLPYCHISDMRGERLVSLSFSDYCDPLVTTPDQWDRLAGALIAENCPIGLRCLHNDIPLTDRRFARVNRARWHGLDLQADLDTVWERLHSSAKRATRKAQRAGIVVRPAEKEADLRAFFELHLSLRKHKYRLLAQPYTFFRHIWHHFIEKGAGILLLATYRDEIIAGILFLEWQNGLFYKFNASSPTHAILRPNDLLTWEGIKYGQAKDLTYLDFGLSDWGQSGLINYKRKFATVEKTISFMRYEPDQPPVPGHGQIRQLLPELTSLFTDSSVPDCVTERAGELLYRYFT